MNELLKYSKQLYKQNPPLFKKIMRWAKQRQKDTEKEIKSFKFKDGFLNPCKYGVQAYFYYLADHECMKTLTKNFKQTKKGKGK